MQVGFLQLANPAFELFQFPVGGIHDPQCSVGNPLMKVVHFVVQVASTTLVKKCAVPFVFDAHLLCQLNKDIVCVFVIAPEHLEHISTAR